jgi:hypothetical protein
MKLAGKKQKMILDTLTKKQKDELVLFVLNKAPIWLFNISITSFSVQRLYSRYKRELLSEFPNVMKGELDYAIVMAEAFRKYQCDEIRCPELKSKIDNLKYKAKLQKMYDASGFRATVTECNKLVEEYSDLLKPQNDLIRLYKSIQKTAA